MKVRKLAVALALAAGLGSGLAHALGMGEGRMLTNLNEPLRAEIELTRPGDLSADQINVSLASQSDFERFGINRRNMLRRLDLNVARADDGGFILEVSTDEPVREPFINMLLELSWPNGRLLREYSFLVDPPERSPGPEDQGPRTTDSSPDSGQQRSPQPEGERETRARATAGGDATDEAQGTREEYGPTGSNDTLWGIAGQVRAPRDATRQQIMLALQQANPEAFVNNNINQLRRGQVLRLPSAQEIRSRTSREAVREVRAQIEAHRRRRGDSERVVDDAADSTGQPGDKSAGGPSAGESQSGDDELQILVADNDSGEGDGDIAGMGDGEGNERLANALEELDRAQRDREELESRLTDLEKQIDTMSQLIELKDDQLADMQQRLKEADKDTAIPDQQAGTEREMDASGEKASEQQAATEDRAGEEVDDTEKAGVAEADAGDGESEPGTSQGPESGQGDDAGVDSAPEDQRAADSGDQDPSAGEADAGAPEGETAKAQGTSDQDKAAPPITNTPTTIGELFDRLVRDPVYQIGAGVLGILLLLVLWTLMRRNAARERNFYEQLREDTGEQDLSDVLDLAEGEEANTSSIGEEAANGFEPVAESVMDADESEDVIGEAEFYMAYGRLGRAAERLEEGISQEPSRADLRLKLLEAYAGLGDSGNFEKQHRELTVLGDDEAIEEADALRQKFEAGTGDFSIDELTEQLKTAPGAETDSGGDDTETEDDAFDFSALDEAEDPLREDQDSGFAQEEQESGFESKSSSRADEAIEFDLEAGQERVGGEQEAELEDGAGSAGDISDLGFSLDDLELEEPETQQRESATDDDELDLDLEIEDDTEIPTAGEKQTPVSDGSPDVRGPLADADETRSGEPLAGEDSEPPSDIGETLDETEGLGVDFDDSFLEELDAELDRVTKEESPDFEQDETGNEEPRAGEPMQSGEEESGSDDEALAAKEPERESGSEDESVDLASGVLEDSDSAQEQEGSEGLQDTAETQSPGAADWSETPGDMDDLELDVSEDDLALMDEFAGDETREGETASSGSGDGIQSGEELLESDMEGESTEEALSDEEIAALEGEAPDSGTVPESGDAEETREQGSGGADTPATEAPQSAEGDEDDEFDFLEGTDEAGTKLDLARAYVDMGDAEGAREILEEVVGEGSDDQKQEALRLLNEL